MNKIIASVIMFLCLTVSTAFAEMNNSNQIFDNYNYGMSKEKIVKQFTGDEFQTSTGNNIIVTPTHFFIKKVNANVTQLTFEFDSKDKLNGCTIEYKNVKVNPLEKENVIYQLKKQLEKFYGKNHDSNNVDGTNYQMWFDKHHRLTFTCVSVDKDTYDLSIVFESRDK